MENVNSKVRGEDGRILLKILFLDRERIEILILRIISCWFVERMNKVT